MTRSWARMPTGGGWWHYFPRGLPTRAVLGFIDTACGVTINGDDSEERTDGPGREIPDPACHTCWLARQAVETYRRSIVPDPAQVAMIQRIRKGLEEARAASFHLNDDVLLLQVKADELAQAIADREAP